MTPDARSDSSALRILGAMVILVLVVAGFVVWRMLDRGTPPRGAGPTAERNVDKPARPDREIDNGREPRATNDRRPPAPPLTPDVEILTRSEVTRVLLRVVDEDLEPLAGASVRLVVAPDDDVPERVPLEPPLPDLDETDWDAGEAFTTDAEGAVLLPAFDRRARVIATHRDGDVERLGRRELTPRDLGRQVTLTLRPTRSLVIRTFDSGGRSIGGVPVGLYYREHGMGAGSRHTLWLGTTRESDGTVEIPNAQDYAWVNGIAPGPPVELLVAVAFPVQYAIEHALDPTALPEDPIDLYIPETGSMKIHLVAPTGVPFREPAGVWLGARLHYSSGPFTVEIFTDEGEVTLPFVETGISFDCEVETRARDYLTVNTHVEGPQQPGEFVETVVQLDLAPTLVASLITPDGATLAGRPVEVRLRHRRMTRPRSERSRTKTDAVGAIAVPLPIEGRDGPDAIANELRRIEAVHIGVPFTAGGPTRQFEYEALVPYDFGASLETRVPGVPFDLGRVTLDPLPALVSGRVVDGSGNPVEGAVVRAIPGQDLETTTDGDGLFEIFGNLDRPKFEVRAYLSGYRQVGATLRVEKGTEGVELVLAPATSLEGRVLLPAGAPLSLTVALDSPRRKQTARVVRDGYFQMNLPEGPATLTFRILGEEAPCAVVGPIAIELGRVNDIGTIDLRDRIRHFVVRVLDTAGAPLPDAFVTVGTGSRTPCDSVGRATIATGLDLVDLEVSALGYRSVALTTEPVDREVVLDEGVRLEIRIAADSALPDPSHDLACTLNPVDGRRSTTREVDPARTNGIARAYLVPPGSYRVTWVVTRLAESGNGPMRFLSQPIGDPLVVDAPDSAGPHIVTLRFTEDEVAAAVEALDRELANPPR